MIEIINGTPTTLETVNLALLAQKIDNESKQLMKCCERFQSNVSLVSSSLSDILTVMTRISNICLSDESSGLTQDIGNFLSEDLIKQSHVLESLRIFDVECSGILKNVKEKTKVMKERKSLLKKNHSKNMKLKEKDIRNFNKIERSNKNKRKFAEKDKDFQVANLLLDCKNLEDRAKFSLVEIAGLERNLFNEYLLSLKQIFLLQRELFSTARVSCSITRLDQILQNDRISVDAVSGVLSVSRNKSTTENEAGSDGTKSPAASPVEKPSECEWSQGSDRTSVMSECSSESLTVSLRKSGGRFSTVRRRSASPLRGQDYVARPVPCSPPVIQPSDPLTSNSRGGNLKSCSQTEDFDDDYEVSFYMNNMAGRDGGYFSFDRLKDEVI